MWIIVVLNLGAKVQVTGTISTKRANTSVQVKRCQLLTNIGWVSDEGEWLRQLLLGEERLGGCQAHTGCMRFALVSLHLYDQWRRMELLDEGWCLGLVK